MPTSGINIEAFNLGCAVHKFLSHQASVFFGGDLSEAATAEVDALWETIFKVSQRSHSGQLSRQWHTASAEAGYETLVSQLRDLREFFTDSQKRPGWAIVTPSTGQSDGEPPASETPEEDATSSDDPSQESPVLPMASAGKWQDSLRDHFNRFWLTAHKELRYVVTQLAVLGLSDAEKDNWLDSFNFGFDVDCVARPVESAWDLFDIIKVVDPVEGHGVSFSVIDRENTRSDESVTWKPLRLQDAARNNKRYWVVEYSKTSVTASNEDEIVALHRLTNLPDEARSQGGRWSVPDWMLVVRRDAPLTIDSGERALADRFYKLTGIQLGKCPHTESSAVADWYAEVLKLTEIYRVNRIDGSSRFLKCGDADRPQLKLENLCVRSLKREAKPQSWVMDQLNGKTILEACGGFDVADNDMSWDGQRSAFSDFASKAKEALPSLNFSCKGNEASKSGRVTMNLAFLPQPDDVPPRS